nr:bifunctional UDP-sugar hydrolase/5'-nucleotidase UshA [Conchiformibius kuhniae]
MMMKRRCCAAAVVLLLAQGAYAYTLNQTYRFTVLHTNDIHGRFWHNEQGEYGMAAQKTLIDRIKKEVAEQGGQVLLLSAGDHNTGVPESDIQNAKPDIEGMNLLGYEAAVLGNHEFDKPVDVLRQQEQQAKFPFLAANVRQKNGEYLVKPYTVLNKGGLKIAVVGLTTEDTPKLSAHAAAMDFEKPAAAARRTLKELAQTHRPDVRIALTHMGYYHNGKHGDNAPGDVSLARSLKNEAGQQFDLIIGGHSHTTVCVHEDGSFNHDFKPGDDCRPDYQNGAWIVQAGEWGKYLGRADFEFRNGRTKLVGYRLIPINLKQKIQTADGQTEYRPYGETIAPDAEVAAALQPYQDEGSRLLDINIGTGTGAFEGGRDAVRHRQTNLGRLITEAYRKRLKADIALVNSGAIRDSLPEGDITYKQVLKVHPFGNTMGRVRLSGRELSDYLHTVALKQAGSGAYAQFSGNLSMDIDHDNQRVRNIRINGITASGRAILHGGIDGVLCQRRRRLSEFAPAPFLCGFGLCGRAGAEGIHYGRTAS